MEMKRLLCHDVGRFQIVPGLLLPLLSLLILGCGGGSRSVSPEAKPPDLPAIASDRYEQVQVIIDGKPVDANTTITVGRAFVVAVSFRRRHVWPGLDNPESLLHALIMEQDHEYTLTRRTAFLDWQSEKDGVLTFADKVEALQEPGVFGLWIRENVTTETETPGVGRYLLFAANVRNVKP